MTESQLKSNVTVVSLDSTQSLCPCQQSVSERFSVACTFKSTEPSLPHTSCCELIVV